MIKITYKGPDISGRAMTATIKAALDDGFKNHRAKFLQIHFTRAALTRYPVEYAKSTKPAQSRKGEPFAKLLSRLSAEARAALMKELRERKKNPRSKSAKAQKLPLVVSGRLRSTILSGVTQFGGTVAKRHIAFSPPVYTFFNPTGRINKVRAIQAVAAGESEEFARVADGVIQKYLSSTNQVQTS